MSHGDATSRLSFHAPDVTLRSAGGDREAVVLDGGYGTSELISIHASGVVIADLTLTRAWDHPVHVSGSSGHAITGVMLHNLHVVDPGQQAIKVNPVDDGYVDAGTIQCCLIELTDTGRGHIRDSCYTGGIDVHQARGWLVRRNRIQGFWCDTGLSEHGIHFWRCCRDTVVEENVIAECARGVGYGLGSTGSCRTYADDPYPGVGFKGHIDGVIRNNFVSASVPALLASPNGFDTGIGLEQAYGAIVVHNTVVSTSAPVSSSIEWRFPNSVVELDNNLASSILLARDGGQGTLAGNLEHAPLSWFADPAGGDLHLTPAAGDAVNAGIALPGGLCDTDIDGQGRDAEPDVGADEALPDLVFADGFESGDTTIWAGVTEL